MATPVVVVRYPKGQLGVLGQVLLVMMRIFGGMGAQLVTDRVEDLHVQLLHLITEGDMELFTIRR